MAIHKKVYVFALEERNIPSVLYVGQMQGHATWEKIAIGMWVNDNDNDTERLVLADGHVVIL